MTGEEMAVKLAETEARSKSNTHRLDHLEKSTEAINRLATSVEVMAKEQKHQTEAIEEVKTDLSDLSGKVEKIEGDPLSPYNQGRLCMRCLDVQEMLYHPDRLLHPMKRDPKYRGQADKWERITWEEAYDLIDKKFTAIRDEYGGKSIIFASGTGRVTPPINARLGYALGSIQYSYFHSGNACYVPRVAAANTIQGCYTVPDFSMQFPDRYDNPEWVAPKNIFVWGNNPLVPNADGNIGHWIVDCMKRFQAGRRRPARDLARHQGGPLAAAAPRHRLDARACHGQVHHGA